MTNSKAPAPEAGAKAEAIADQDRLSLEQLAKGVLAREFRPRSASIRRLAEAVLALAEADAAKAAKKKRASKKSGSKKPGGKKRKLAKIPGQKKK